MGSGGELFYPMKRQAGYMLLEVVLALSIFIVAVVGLLSCLKAGLDADYEQQRFTNTRQNLQSLLDESLATEPREGTKDFSPDAFNVSYRREIKPARVRLDDGKNLDDIFRVSVVAMDTQRDKKIIGELWTYASR